MRLSLRTLLAFEDNVFDVEQHRRLEQLLPTDQHAEASLQRIRSVVRNSTLGVPGLVDRQEELDPNYVAEYLDHQMPGNVQDKFEVYCLSADKYLAEIASIHHILSNVLGEPARTSRECRFKCYDALTTNTNMSETKNSASEQSKHFRPYDSSTALVPVKPASFWSRLFPVKPRTATQSPALFASSPALPAEQKKSPLWTFTILGLCICALYLGWQQLEDKRTAHQFRHLGEVETPVAENDYVAPEIADPFASAWEFQASAQEVAEPTDFLMPPASLTPLEPIEQAVYVKETFEIPTEPITDPFAVITEVLPPMVQDIAAPEPPATPAPPVPPASATSLPNLEIAKTDSEPIQEFPKASATGDEPMITFHPMTSSARIPADVPVRQSPRPTPSPEPSQQFSDTPPGSNVYPATGRERSMPAAPMPMPLAAAPVQHPMQTSQSQPVVQVSGTMLRPLGRAVPMPQPSVVFSAESAQAPWELQPLPFDLYGEQYLLTAAPFRGTFELAGSFRIEMFGDAKLCILPLDASGIPGIFVDYGRVIIHPLQPNRPLRIETEKSRGIVSVPGTESVLFVDTFAEITDPSNSTRPPIEQKPKTGPILGFVPKNGERIVWQSAAQSQPFYVSTQGSMLLQSNQYRFGEIQLPNWLGTIPMTQEERMLAEACRRCFVDARGDGEKALTWMMQDESRAVRTLGLRLWGDLGRFDIPLTLMVEKRVEDEQIRSVLARYFEEVMRRDAETVQRFADAIEVIKEARR